MNSQRSRIVVPIVVLALDALLVISAPARAGGLTNQDGGFTCRSLYNYYWVQTSWPGTGTISSGGFGVYGVRIKYAVTKPLP